MQGSAPPEAEYKEDAMRLVKGWKAGILEAVENTPLDGITRNRIADRCSVLSILMGCTLSINGVLQA